MSEGEGNLINLLKFCEYQQEFKVCDHLNVMLCTYEAPPLNTYYLCNIRPENVKLIQNYKNPWLYLAHCECKWFKPVKNFGTFVRLTNLVFNKADYELAENDLEYILIDLNAKIKPAVDDVNE